MAVGRPPFEITPEVIAKVEKLAAQGLAEYQIAAVLGIHRLTLQGKKEENSDFNDAIKNGKAKGIAKITNKLFEKANDGDNTSMIFYLKNRDPDNWEDVQKRKITGGDGGPVESEVTINVNYK